MTGGQGEFGALGMYGVERDRLAPGQTVVGAKSAVDGFLTALVRHGSTPLRVFCGASNLEAIANEMARRAGGDGRQVGVHDYRALLDDFERYEIGAWHSAWDDTSRPFRLRQACGASLYPITMVNHTAGYQYLLETVFLSLLVADVRPCDALVCSSRAAQSAVLNTFHEVAEGLRRAHGTRVGFRGRVERIPLSVDTDLFRPRDRDAVRDQLGLPLDALIVLWAGRVSAVDKADLLPLLLAFRDVLDRSPGRDIRLVVAGSDRAGHVPVVRHFAAELGIRESVELRRLEPAYLTIAAADVFVSPVDSIQETGGLTPIEAMACGVPQVVADWDGYRDTVVDGETGFLVPTRWNACDRDPVELALVLERLTYLDLLALGQSVAVDVGALGEAIETLLNNDDLRARMGQRSRERAVSEFAWPTMIGRFEALWSELAALAADEPRPSPTAAYDRPAFFESFRSYPSDILDERARLRISPRGRRVLAGDEPLPAYLDELGVLDFDLIEQVLVELYETADTARLGELAQRVAASTEQPAHRARRHLMWLLKYDLAAVDHPQPPPGT